MWNKETVQIDLISQQDVHSQVPLSLALNLLAVYIGMEQEGNSLHDHGEENFKCHKQC